jgi:hypothetical protein
VKEPRNHLPDYDMDSRQIPMLARESNEFAFCRILYTQGRGRPQLHPGPVGLADTTAEDEAATGTAFAFM